MNPKDKKIFITGIAGFIGFHLAKRLLSEGFDVIGIDTENAVPCSGKTGEGIDEILEKIIDQLPGPKGNSDENLKCLLVDSWYDSYLGVVILVRVINGKISKNMKIKMISTNQDYIVEKVEIFYTHHKSYRSYVKLKVSKDNVALAISEIKADKKLAQN